MTSIVSSHAAMAGRPVTAALAVAALFPFSALAQTTVDNAHPIVVVTAARSPQAARDILTDNIVITEEEIAQSGLTSLPDLLQKKRGIEIARNGGPGTASSVFIRGGSNNLTVVLVDGVRTGSSTSGGATWAAIPLSQIDHVEIVYGPLSTLYGADAVSGVVQIFTKKGSGAPRFSVSAGGGSHATRSLEAAVSGATQGDHRFSYAISAAHDRADGFNATRPALSSFNADDDGYTKDNASGQFSLALAAGHEIGFSFLHSRLDSQFDSGASAFDARGIGKLGTYSMSSTNQILPNWSSQLRLYQSTDKADSLIRSGTSTFNTKQNDLSWQNDVNIGPDLLQVVFERREENVESTIAALIGKRTTNSAGAAYLLKRGRHLANLSARGDDSSQFGSHTTGSAGYGYRITEALRANAGFGTSFRAPTFNESFFPGFGIATNQPEKGRNAEIGLHYDDRRTQFSAAYYRNRISNLIVNTNPCPVLAGAYAFGCAYNVNQALLTGVTMGAATSVGDFSVRGSLDFQDPRDETTGKSLARRAKRHGSLAVEYGADRIKAGVDAVFSGERFDNAGNTVSMGGYGLLNLYASVEFGRDWVLFGRWNNVLNKDYELAKNYATAGSNLFVGIRYEMK